jgi:hypothetical protein
MLRELALRWSGRSKRREAPAREAAAEAGGGSDEPEPWVIVLTCYDTVLATLAVARLQDQGLPARTRQEAASSVYPVGVGLLGRIDVMVPQSVEDTALSVLDDTLGEGLADDESLGPVPQADE